jgi:Fur family transcriptional regulator, ferric uptake regulator
VARFVDEQLTRELRSKGYRLTPQRQLVLAAVDSLEHATADSICAEVRQTASGVNLSTVYRTLELLEELGLVSRTHLGHGAPVYHAVGSSDHLHLVCRSCGKVEKTDVAVAEGLVALVDTRYGFEADVSHLGIFGRCRECRDRD